VSYDRYKACRRHCTALRAILDIERDLVAVAEEYFKKKAKEKDVEGDLFGTKYIGKNIPDATLGCKFCSFIAKSERGLRIHMKRTHKVKDNKEKI
jgi:hypothetical protein